MFQVSGFEFQSRARIERCFQRISMSRDNKKSVGLAIILMLLGVLAVYGGLHSLMVLIPAAMVVWYEAKTILGSGRN